MFMLATDHDWQRRGRKVADDDDDGKQGRVVTGLRSRRRRQHLAARRLCSP